jgi:quinol monooxygenase YgiN
MTTSTFTGEGLMILINIKMQIRPEKIDDWLAVADAYAKDVNSEDGCLFFQWSRSLTDDNEFICIEGFTDGEAGGTHVKQPYVKKFFETAPRSRRSSTSTPRTTASARWERSSLADTPLTAI